jgi:hypothetical protein
MGLTVLVIIAGALSLMLRERRGGQPTIQQPTLAPSAG